MTRYSAPLPSVASAAYPAAVRDKPEQSTSLFVVAVYMGYFLFSYLGVAALLIALLKRESLPIEPVVFAASFLLIVPWTKSKPMDNFPYFLTVWVFWFLFSVGGFLGAARLAGVADKELWQLILKIWINLIGSPILTLRAISRDRLHFLQRVAVLAGAVGGFLSIVQTRYYEVFSRVIAEKGRGAGFWLNPNTCSRMLVFSLLFSLVCPFKSKLVNYIIRGTLLLGTLATLSRTGVLILLVGFGVYSIAAKKVRVFIQIAIAAAVVVVIGNLMIGYMQTSATKANNRRLQKFSNILHGKMADEGKEMDRLAEWGYAWDAIRRDPLIGRGHRSMDYIVPVAQGIGPHNYFLYVWGNSGFLALLGFIAYLFALWRIARRCVDVQVRAPLMGMAATAPVIAMTDHGMLGGSWGPAFAVMIATAYYNRPQKSKAQASAIAAARPLPRGRTEPRPS